MMLRNGPHVRDSAIELACALEAKGHAMTAESGVLRISNGSALSAEDRAAIVREKPMLVAICEYISSGACDA